MNKTKFGTDRVLAAAVGIAAFVLMCVWPFDGLHPHVWEDVAIASGILPQGKMLPGLGVYLAHLPFVVLPYGAALWLNGLLAKLAVAFSGMMVFGILKGMVDLSAGGGAHDMRRRAIAGRMAAFVAAFLFVCSEPMWKEAQGITGSGFVMLLVLFASRFFISFLEKPSFANTLTALFATGVLCAETPFGWLFLAFFIFMTVRYLAYNKTDAWAEFLDPVVMQKTKWSMTFLFVGSFIAGILLEVFAFAMLDGLKAAGSTFADLPLIYAQAYFGSVTGAFNFTGGCLFVAVAVIPFALSFLTAVSSTDEDRYLPFKFSLVHFACGLVAFLQLSPFSLAWFWSAFENVSVSPNLVLFGTLLSSVTLAWALFVLGIEVLCRDYKRIERILYQHYQEDEYGRDEPVRMGVEGRTTEKSVKLGLGRILVLALPVALVVISANGRRCAEDRQLLSILREFIDETISEALGTKYVFTDGAFDAWVRIEARRRGVGLNTVSLMSGVSPPDGHVRVRGQDVPRSWRCGGAAHVGRLEGREDERHLRAGRVRDVQAQPPPEAGGLWTSRAPRRRGRSGGGGVRRALPRVERQDRRSARKRSVAPCEGQASQGPLPLRAV